MKTKKLQSLLIILFTSILSYSYFSTQHTSFIEDGQYELSITPTDTMKIDGRMLKGFVTVNDGSTCYIQYRFRSAEEKALYQSMDLFSHHFTVQGAFVEISKPAHMYAFQMERYLKMNGAIGIFEIHHINHIERFTSIQTRLLSIRQSIRTHIEKTFPSTLITEAHALIIGDRQGMDNETKAMYQKLGITHLFAISGLHVGLLTLLVREILLRCSLRREIVHIMLFIGLPIYAIIVGSAPSVWRAVSVTMLLLLFSATNLRIPLNQVLALTLLWNVWLKPEVLLQPGFQLSYGATFALILSAPILQQTTSYLKQSFLITLISQIALAPVLLVHFYELSLSSFFVNLLYVPVYSFFILPMNMCLLFLSMFFPPIADILFFFYEPVRSMIENFTHYLNQLPYQLWTPGKPASSIVFILVIGLLSFFICLEKQLQKRWMFFSLLIPVVMMELRPYLDSNMYVTYLDVGQGDSIVIELPYRKGVYLIDTGGVVPFGERDWQTPMNEFEVGRQIVVPYLKGKGITKIHKLILSHPHLDHIGSAHEIIEELNVKEIHTAPNSTQVDEMKNVLQAAQQHQVPIKFLKDGIGWDLEEIRFTYMGPQTEQYEGNDSSLVLYMEARGYGFLFTGDIEEKGEKLFVEKYDEHSFPPTILKVAHHGSKTSSSNDFLQLVNPFIAISSQGKNNRFHHPHEEVVDRYVEKGIPFYTTKDNQSIVITVSKNQNIYLRK